jgi:hypothetical protein
MRPDGARIVAAPGHLDQVEHRLWQAHASTSNAKRSVLNLCFRLHREYWRHPIVELTSGHCDESRWGDPLQNRLALLTVLRLYLLL